MRSLNFAALIAAGVIICSSLVAPKDAGAVGAGCSALAGQSRPIAGVANFTGEFEAGDALTFRITITAAGTSPAVDIFGVAAAPGVFPVANAVVTVVSASTGTLNFGGGFQAPIGGATGTLTFIGCNSEGALQSISGQAARASLTQQSGLVFQRTGNLLLNKPANRVNPDLQTSSLPQAGLTGGAGQGAEPFGVWADFTWSGLDNDDAATGSDANVFTLSGGYDTPVTNRLIAGAAVSFGGATFDPIASDDTAHEINFGVTPYVAYQVDEIFALQAAAGFTHARGFAEIGDVDGDFATNRYFVAAEASAFQAWDEISLFSSVGILWGQSFQQAYTDDAGSEFGSIRTNLGSVSVIAQPAYLITLDPDAGDFIEPFLLGQYSYDFTQTKVRGAANDPDEFLLGAGVNAFTGDGLSGTLEFNRTLGREDNTATTVRATGRMDF